MKKALKEQIFSKRSSLSANEIKKKSASIKTNLYSLQEFNKSKNILFYVSFDNEVDTQEIIRELLGKKGKNIIVPYVEEGNSILQISELQNFNELEPKTFGILEPKLKHIRKFKPNNLDLVIIPGIAFDLAGNRIGYGYGYYDRFLKQMKHDIKKIALAYEFQIVERIPAEKHDARMDMIVTEKKIINIGTKS